MGNYAGQLVTIAVLIALNAYFAAAEMSLVSARRTALQSAADKGSVGARVALRLLDDPNRLLSAISVAITLVGFTAASLAAVTFEKPLADLLRSAGVTWITPVASGLAVFLVTIAVTYFTLVFGELAPKRLGLQRSVRVAQAVARPVAWLAVALTPLIWVLGRSTDGVARILGVHGTAAAHGVSEEEIRLLVRDQGTLLEEEKRMIGGVLEIGNTVAREIMVPRVDVVMIEDTVSVGDALPRFRTSGFSRVPVFHDDPDSVVGVALLKDLLQPVAAGSIDAPLANHARPPLFVPETKQILDLLQEMRVSHNHMVIVVDEHGGTAGIVTIEDIIEEIVGEITDEYDRDHRYIEPVGDGEWMVDGRLPVEDAIANLSLPIPEAEEYDTLAGWVLSELGHIPVVGEIVDVAGARVRVEGVRRRRISRLRVTAVGTEPAQEAPGRGQGKDTQ
ncbi:MAG TPA: hemolysin family protein [Coriobacteriia bacterium]